MSNYKPFSNLPFLAKVLQHVVVGQLQNHFSMNRLLESFQAGTVQRVMNELLITADSGACGILVLDLNAAFDTMSHYVAGQTTQVDWSFWHYIELVYILSCRTFTICLSGYF